MNKNLKKKLLLAALCGAVLPATFAGEAAAEENVDAAPSYDFGTSDVYGEKTAVPPQEPSAPEPEKEAAEDYGAVTRAPQTGLLGERDIMDTPYNVIGYTAENIERTQDKTLAAVVEQNASVNVMSGGTASEAWSIRGFDVGGTDVAYNGLYGIAPSYSVGTEALDRVDVLTGPAAMLSGVAPGQSVGGIINLVPKRAPDDGIRRVTVGLTNGHQKSVAVDVGERFGTDKQFGVRVNGAWRKGQTAYDREEQDYRGFALALDARGKRWNASLDFGFQDNDVDNPTGIVTMGRNGLPARKMRSRTNLAAPGTYAHTIDRYAMLHGDYALTDDARWKVFADFGIKKSTQDYVRSSAVLTNAALGTATMRKYFQPSSYEAHSEQLGVRGKAQTGVLTHDLLLAASSIHQDRESNSFNLYRDNAATLSTFTQNIYTPDFAAIGSWSFLSAGTDTSLRNRSTVDYRGISFIDTIATPDKRWQVMLGARWQKLESEYYNARRKRVTSHYDKQKLVPSFGFVYKFNPRFSGYANYSESLQEGGWADYTNAPNYGEVFAPIIVKQKEFGFKYDMGAMATTLSFYEIKKPSVIQDDVTLIMSQAGETRGRGVELNVFGDAAKNVHVLASLAYMKNEYTKENPGFIGKTPQGYPSWKGTLGLEYDVPGVEGLFVSGKLVYVGSQYTNAANKSAQEVPSWTRFDLGARYKFMSGKTPMTLTADIINLFDRSYWVGVNNGAYMARPRTFMISLSAEL